MLKWTASAQKLTMDSPNVVPHTPRRSELEHRRRRARRATIANKENIPYVTSTPMVRAARNSPIVLAPLADILNITPEINSPARTSSIGESVVTQQQEMSTEANTTISAIREERLRTRILPRNRRHSTLGITLPSAVPVYARTLPRFQVEEYSPSTAPPTGQQLALRGLIADPFLGNARYFTTPEIKKQQQAGEQCLNKSPLGKRKLDLEFNEECEHKFSKPAAVDTTTLSSAKMGDETLDKLIDAILDSARKDVKKKKPKKSFNLRRRTLMRNQPETVHEVVLSPSYTAGDDPASDLSFLLFEPTALAAQQVQPPQTPAPTTPPSSIAPVSTSYLCKLPTPTPEASQSTNSFNLETPIRVHQTRKRRKTHHCDVDTTEAVTNQAKKFKVDARNYFEIGVALPSIYV